MIKDFVERYDYIERAADIIRENKLSNIDYWLDMLIKNEEPEKIFQLCKNLHDSPVNINGEISTYAYDILLRHIEDKIEFMHLKKIIENAFPELVELFKGDSVVMFATLNYISFINDDEIDYKVDALIKKIKSIDNKIKKNETSNKIDDSKKSALLKEKGKKANDLGDVCMRNKPVLTCADLAHIMWSLKNLGYIIETEEIKSVYNITSVLFANNNEENSEVQNIINRLGISSAGYENFNKAFVKTDDFCDLEDFIKEFKEKYPFILSEM